MKTVIKNEHTFVPRDAVEFFRINSHFWYALKDGHSVELTDEAYEKVKKYVTLLESTPHTIPKILIKPITK